MAQLRTTLDTHSEKYRRAHTRMSNLIDEIEQLQTAAQNEGSSAAAERHRSRGKLTARERVALLLDPLGPFLELSPLAGWGTKDPLGGGLVTGIGYVNGRSVVVIANDPTVRGGTVSPTTLHRTIRALEVAQTNRLPVVTLVESGGADLERQSESFIVGGQQFRRLTQLSAAGIPTISVVLGSSTAGGAYVPGMSDYTIFVRDQGYAFLGGPPLVKMAIDEDTTDQDLGGAEMHARTSGLADYLAADEQDAFRYARELIARFPVTGRTPGGPPPVCDPEELLGVVPADPQHPFDIREVLARILDASQFDEFKPLYGPNLVTGWGEIDGIAVGVLANNGILFSPEAQKGSQFIQLANQRGIPLLFLQNITGFMVGSTAEHGGIIKDGAKLINAVSNSRVPHITVMVGVSYGAGNYAMAGRSYNPRLVLTWPNHRIAVMGGRQLAGVLSIVRRQAAERRGLPFDEAADERTRAQLEQQIDAESTALYATGHLWDDGVIDPRHTRIALAIALAAATGGLPEPAVPGAFGIFRH
ncbi:acyl-CoA carboxylase subunit beta [Nocardia fusca]|uniref:acyl-CoA carboxylase subunit beta n=1 Tax=Nocardia fusca TaxID=941183 RepID=UPI0037A460A2